MKNLQVLIIITLVIFRGQGQTSLTDLTQGGSFSANSAQWTCSTGGFPTSSCFGNTLLGGYGNFGTGSYAYRTFTGLPTHSSITISFWAYYIDSWDSECYLVWEGSTLIYSNSYAFFTLGTMNYCGASYPDYNKYTTIYNISHSSSTLFLNFSTNLDESALDESFGVSDITITVCDPTCNTCNTVETQCTSCTGSYYLSGTLCVTTCPTGTYPNSSTHTCSNCDGSCYACNGAGTSACTQCTGSTELNLPPTGSCSSFCPVGYYGSSNNQCLQCFQGSGPTYYSCATCSGGTNTNCISCNSGYFLYFTTCLNPCPAGYWGQTSNNVCQPCYNSGSGPDYTCATCSAGAYNNCISCNSGYFLYSNTCLNPCPAGYWGRTSDNTCQPCYSSGSSPDYTCATCSAGAYNNCLTCNSGYFLYSNSCLNSCPNGYWERTADNTCQPCYNSPSSPYSCATCSAGAANDCNSCSAPYFLYPYTGGQCLASCPAGYYGSSNQCFQCYQGSSGPDYTCATCSAGAYNNCNSCNSGYFLYSNTCFNPCPAGYWGRTSDNTCQICYSSGSGSDYTCATCSAGAYNNCNSCNSGYFLYSNTCINSCPNGYWGRTSDNTCQPCYSSGSSPYTCATCSAGANNNCNSCNSPDFLYPNTGGQCLASCPAGYYGDSTTHTCQPCYSSGSGTDYTCATCSSGAYNNCNSCNSGYFLYSNTCINPCPNGSWGRTSDNTCQPCYSSGSGPDYTCATCSAGAYNNCNSCNSGYFLYSNTCLNPCPDGYWGRTSDNTCQPCYSSGSSPYSCVTCSAGANSNCNSCNSPYYLYPNTGGECLDSCPAGYYEDSSTHTCQPCYSSGSGPDYSCATCSAGGYSNCDSCNSGYFFYSNTCINPCPAGYWGQTSDHPCQPCSSSTSGPDYICATCSAGASTKCNSCNSGTFLYSNACIKSCPAGYFENITANECLPCYNSTTGPYFGCATCTGGESESCTSCYLNTFLYPNITGQCVGVCPDGYWTDNLANKCQICSDESANISSCDATTTANAISVFQSSVTSFATASVAISSTLQSSSSLSAMFSMSLYLCLSAIESIANMRYLNLNHSQMALKAYLGLSNPSSRNWISKLNVINPEHLVFNYGIFEKNQMSSLYLDNYGKPLVQTIIFAAIYLVALILSAFKDKEKLLDSRAGKFYTTSLGIFLSTLFGHIQRQLLFSILQLLRVNLLVDSYSRVSYFMAYLTISSIIGLQIFCFFKLKSVFAFKQRQKETRDRNQEEPSVESDPSAIIDVKWNEKKFGMMFGSFKEDSYNRFFFSYWVTAFNVAYILLIFSLQITPIFQCLSIVVLTIVFIVLSVRVNPIKEKSASFIFFFNFVFILVLGIINLTQAISDTLKDTNNDGFGKAIYYLVMVNIGVNMMFAVLGVLVELYSILKMLINRFKKPKAEVEKQINLEKEQKYEIPSQKSLDQQSESKMNESISMKISNVKEAADAEIKKENQLFSLSQRSRVVIKKAMKTPSPIFGNLVNFTNSQIQRETLIDEWLELKGNLDSKTRENKSYQDFDPKSNINLTIQEL